MARGALFVPVPRQRRTAIATTTAPIEAPPVEASLAELLDHLGIASAHFAGRSLADLQGLIAANPERIASLTLVCPTVLNPRSVAPLGARLMVVTGDHGLGARRVHAVLPELAEATAVVLDDYAGLTWADLAADRGTTSMPRSVSSTNAATCFRRPAYVSRKAKSPISRFACGVLGRRWCCCRSTSRLANGNR